MPAISDNTKWRTQGSSTDLYLFLLKPTTILTGTIDMSTVSYPVSMLTVSIDTGVYTNVREGLTLLLGTDEGLDDLGRVRVSRAMPNVTDLYIGACSRGIKDGTLNVLDGAFFTVLDDHRLWTKPPKVDPVSGIMYKDWNLGVGFPQPKANCGGAFFDLPDPDTLEITVDFDGSTSYALDGGVISHAYDFKDGTPSSSLSESETVTFPPGFRYIEHYIETDLGTNHLQFVPVYNPGDLTDEQLIRDFEVISHIIRPEGQELRIRINEDIDAFEFPDGTLAILIERTTFADGSVGTLNRSKWSTGRDHILFVGWHHDDDTEISGGRAGITRGVELQFLDCAQKLATLSGFTQVVERATTPSNFHQQQNLNLEREYEDYVLRYHSTAMECCEFHPYADEEYPITTLDSGDDSLYGQADKVTRKIACRLTCDMGGHLAITPDPILKATQDQYDDPLNLDMFLAVRTSVSQLTINESDWSKVRYSRTRPNRNHYSRGSAIMTSALDAGPDIRVVRKYVVSPGEVPNQGLGDTEEGDQVAKTTYEHQVIEGNRAAARLNPFEGTWQIDLRPSAHPGIDLASMEWITLNVDTAAAQRKFRFISSRMLPVQMNVSYDHKNHTRKFSVVVEREVSGFPAVEYTVDQNELPVYDNPIDTIGEITPAPLFDSSFGPEDNFVPTRLMAFDIDGTLIRCVGGLDVGTWSTYAMPGGVVAALQFSGGTPGASGYSGQACVDAAQDLYDASVVYVLGPGGVAKVQNPMFGTPVWSAMPIHAPSGYNWGFYGGTSNDFSYGKLHPQVNAAGYFGWLEYSNSNGGDLYYAWTTDYFATYHRTDTGLNVDQTCPGSISLDCFATGAGNVYVRIMMNVYLVESTDGGNTFISPTAIFPGINYNGGVNILGYSKFGGGENRDQSGYGFLPGMQTLGPTGIGYFKGAGSEIGYSYGSGGYVLASPKTLQVLTIDSNHQMALEKGSIFRTEDGWLTFAVTAGNGIPPSAPNGRWINGWPTNPMFAVYGANVYIMLTTDGGSSNSNIYTGSNVIMTGFADFSEVYPTDGIHPVV